MTKPTRPPHTVAMYRIRALLSRLLHPFRPQIAPLTSVLADRRECKRFQGSKQNGSPMIMTRVPAPLLLSEPAGAVAFSTVAVAWTFTEVARLAARTEEVACTDDTRAHEAKQGSLRFQPPTHLAHSAHRHAGRSTCAIAGNARSGSMQVTSNSGKQACAPATRTPAHAFCAAALASRRPVTSAASVRRSIGHVAPERLINRLQQVYSTHQPASAAALLSTAWLLLLVG